MVYSDADILHKVENGELFTEGFKKENLGPCSYDLTADTVCFSDGTERELPWIVRPKEFIIIKTKEAISIPNDIIGRIVERNSVMRFGLQVSGPVYQPGHKTKIFLRVFNMTWNKVKIEGDFEIAQIIFEQLESPPIHPYPKTGTFQNEMEYRGLGRYKDTFKRMKV